MAIGYDPPDRFEKYRHCGAGVPDPEPPGQTRHRAQSSERRARGPHCFFCKLCAGVPVAGEGRGEVSGRPDCCEELVAHLGRLAWVPTP